MSTGIIWFQNDLRLQDNAALYHACKNHKAVILIYIIDEDNPWPMGGAQQWWRYHSIKHLQDSLKEKGGRLYVFKGQPLLILQSLCKSHSIDAIYLNQVFEPYHIKRDRMLAKQLDLKFNQYNSGLLIDPDKIMNKSGGFFKVFTPFWKQCLAQLELRNLYSKPRTINTPRLRTKKYIHQLVKPEVWSNKFSNYWDPGESHAHKKLKKFLKNELNQYKKGRDFLAEDATSNLSPYLHFGEIGPWQIWYALQKLPQNNNVQSFLSELGWREFSYYLLYHFPQLPKKNFNDKFNRFAWNNNSNHLKKWQQGLTGYPVVDAGMHELWETGVMHNRVRMITASFLIKHLLIDWRKGEKWFWDTLLDADLASNSASWQWVAGSGADAAPYFRIFNPILQGKKFDPKGEYVKRWLPELKNVPIKYIHAPWTSPEKINYTRPIVDHEAARERALKRYKKL